MKTEQRKADVLFSAKMANMCLEIQSHITINPDNPLYEECAQYLYMEPHPDDVAELTNLLNRTNGHAAAMNKRVTQLEDVAHLPNQTSLLFNRTP